MIRNATRPQWIRRTIILTVGPLLLGLAFSLSVGSLAHAGVADWFSSSDQPAQKPQKTVKKAGLEMPEPAQKKIGHKQIGSPSDRQPQECQCRLPSRCSVPRSP